jgi:GGDEF domain-containing protein
MAELPRLDALVAGFGRGVADRVAMEIARLLVAEGREADRIAWLGQARFGVLLYETEESAAARYVERVRAASDCWLESVGLSIRLSFGWAGPGADGDVTAAAISAEERMHDASRRTPPAAGSEAGRGGGA